MHTRSVFAAEEHAPPDPARAPPQGVAFHYTQTDSFVALLANLRVSLLVSTYQANKLLAVRAAGCPCWSARSTGRWGWRWTPGG